MVHKGGLVKEGKGAYAIPKNAVCHGHSPSRSIFIESINVQNPELENDVMNAFSEIEA
jgi:hypothetical protein